MGHNSICTFKFSTFLNNGCCCFYKAKGNVNNRIPPNPLLCALTHSARGGNLWYEGKLLPFFEISLASEEGGKEAG